MYRLHCQLSELVILHKLLITHSLTRSLAHSQVLSVEQSEGQGARVRRSIGRPELRNFDPFLMLDEFKVPKTAGFPDHPHR